MLQFKYCLTRIQKQFQTKQKCQPIPVRYMLQVLEKLFQAPLKGNWTSKDFALSYY